MHVLVSHFPYANDPVRVVGHVASEADKPAAFAHYLGDEFDKLVRECLEGSATDSEDEAANAIRHVPHTGDHVSWSIGDRLVAEVGWMVSAPLTA